MSGPAINARAPVDLEDFEARLRGSIPGGAPQSDPLAELARLVEGRPLPFARQQPQQAQPQDPYAPHRDQPYGADPRSAPAYAQPARAPGGWDSHGSGEDLRAEPRGSYGAMDPGARQPQAHDPYQQQAYAPEPVAQPAYAPTPPGAWRPEESSWDEPASQEPPRKSRKGLYAIGGALCLVLAGVGGTIAYRGNPLAANNGTPVIKAATGPMKVAPEAPAQSSTPSNSASVLDKAGEKIGASRMVTSEEQPADLSQVRTGSIPAGGAPARSGSAFPEPIKVKTVSVRPDGTIVSSNDAAKPAQPVTTPSAAQRTASNVTGSTPSAAVPAPANTKPAPQAPAPAAAATPKVTARVAAPADSVEALLAGRPAPAAQPSATGGAALPAVAKGGFAVQLAAAGSDAEARDRIGKLQRQYASALDGKSPGVVKGEANGKDVWRIRVGGLSRDEANAMCGSIKGSGGACFVAAN